MREYIITVYTNDGIDWCYTYTCDENTLETTLRVAKETQYMTSIKIEELK